MAPGVRHPKRDEGLELWNQGHSLKHIADLLGVNDRSVRDWRDRDGWPERSADAVLPQRYSDSRKRRADAEFEAVKDELVTVWKDSFRPKKVGRTDGVVMQGSAQRVAEHFGWSPSKAQGFLKRAGLLVPRPSNSVQGARAQELFESGMSVPRIATEIGVNVDSVRNWLHARGCDLSNHHARRSHAEKIAFRQAVSDGRSTGIAGRGHFNYNGTRLDSSYEVRFAKNLDRLGVAWRTWDREKDGTVEIPGDVSGRYAPDFLVGEIAVEVKGIYDAMAAQKVSTWRGQRGELAVVMKDELFELESATAVEDVMSSLQAFCYLDPPAERAYWS